jgi:two-component system, NarL family, invasion response regulator UvrY
VRVLIVDDHPLMRVGISHLVRQEWPDAQIDEAPTIAEALARIGAARPDLVTLDLSLPDAQGIEGATRLLRVLHGVPLLVLSLNAEAAYASRLMQMGASGYLPKDRAPDELRTALRRLSEGGRYVTASMADHLLGLLSGKAPDALPHELLSAQEHRVMLLIAAGQTPAQIAETMYLSVKTVGSYRARILEKAGWANNTELTKYCVQHGLTEL